MKTVSIGKCEHLNYKECLLRTFEVFDVDSGVTTRYNVCSEYFRLYVNTFRERKRTIINSDYISVRYDEVVESFIIEKTNLPIGRFGFGRRQGTKPNFSVHYRICERPYVFGNVSISEATMLILENRYKYEYDHLFNQFLSSYYSKLVEYANYHLQYKKYKKQHTDLKRILKKLRFGNNIYFVKEEDLNEFFQIIFNLKINIV